LLLQARENFGLDTTRAENDFSVLYRALSAPAIREFIGLELGATEQRLKKPVPKARQKAVGELLLWMFGDENSEPAMKDSRYITQLAVVLEHKAATEKLRATGDLVYAFTVAGGEARRFIENLEKASYHLDESLPDAHRNKGNATAVALVHRCWETMQEIVRHFPKAVKPGQ
jgi:hypothetical protein